MNGEAGVSQMPRQTLKKEERMKVKNPLNPSIEIKGVVYKEVAGSMEVPDEIALMLIETFGFSEVKEVKKSKKPKED